MLIFNFFFFLQSQQVIKKKEYGWSRVFFLNIIHLLYIEDFIFTNARKYGEETQYPSVELQNEDIVWNTKKTDEERHQYFE